ncbi:alpha/beta hydrolase [Catellatospora sp. KI3]|uniref:alpha/beta fold hydrolase n=1 Tax=Catellatospora sp. KI3 TaxID=3041620 RepID=UPI002483202C|nr:alpha/beta hydrolase [Catellatospora sp. KI3]MDI1461131.1 alpha/beta hydrolase [Catellatospora sp. KI3]
MKRFRSLALVPVLLAALVVVPAAPAGASLAPMHCTQHTLPVRLSETGAASYSMWGELCYRGPRQPRTVQLLVHGAGYNHVYFDIPYGDGYYSYVRAATLVGYATFNVDRIGAGRSSHPASPLVNIAGGSVALHDAITALRSGAVSGTGFGKVIWVGHSYGSIYGWKEISTYHDVDAFINTAALHVFNQPHLNANIFPNFYGAAADPAFAGLGLDPGYLTSKPDMRHLMYYVPETSDAGALAADEANKDVVSYTQLTDLAAIVALPPASALTQGITVPTLIVNGQADPMHCSAVAQDCSSSEVVQQFESQYYPAQARLRTVLIPDTGHNTVTSTTSPYSTAVMLAWSLSVAPPF